MDTVVASTAQVHKRAITPELLARVKRRAMGDPAVFDERAPFIFAAEISNRQLDAYFTHMAVSTLKNYADDAESGVAFQNSHNCFELPFGRSISGKYEGDDENGRVVAEFFTVPGIQLNGVSTDDLVMGIRSGIIADVSVGFYGGRHICDVCGFNLFDSENCRHYPGFEAEIADPDNPEVKRVVIATATIEDAHLAEVSAVYDGATPGAVILKAQAEMDAGRLQPKQARLLEDRYRIKLPGARHLFAGTGDGDMTTKRETEAGKTPPSPDPQTPPPADPPPAEPEGEAPPVEEVRAALSRAGIEPKGTLTERLNTLASEIIRLRPLASDGQKYRDDLTALALKEAVRAGFSEETYKAILSRATVEEIKRMCEDFGVKGDDVFKGGRKTTDTAEEQVVETRRKPAGAYAG